MVASHLLYLLVLLGTEWVSSPMLVKKTFEPFEQEGKIHENL